MTFDWLDDTRPFTDVAGAPARFVVRQVTDVYFRIETPFWYRPPTGGEPIEVTDETLGPTDFASIPGYMSWFVSRFGRHTPAALLHDQLVKPTMAPRDRVIADRVFLSTMDELNVPPVRGRVMWSAVALATRWCMRPWGQVGVALWALGVITGTSLLLWGIATATWWVAALALAGPFAGAFLWGRQYWAGVIGGYALWIVAVPSLSALGVYYGVYWPLEQVVRVVRSRLPSNRAEPVPGPPSYKAA